MKRRTFSRECKLQAVRLIKERGRASKSPAAVFEMPPSPPAPRCRLDMKPGTRETTARRGGVAHADPPAASLLF
jgi:transposase-like protein